VEMLREIIPGLHIIQAPSNMKRTRAKDASKGFEVVYLQHLENFQCPSCARGSRLGSAVLIGLLTVRFESEFGSTNYFGARECTVWSLGVVISIDRSGGFIQSISVEQRLIILPCHLHPFCRPQHLSWSQKIGLAMKLACAWPIWQLQEQR
jgi:hypothetical protein